MHKSDVFYFEQIRGANPKLRNLSSTRSIPSSLKKEFKERNLLLGEIRF